MKETKIDGYACYPPIPPNCTLRWWPHEVGSRTSSSFQWSPSIHPLPLLQKENKNKNKQNTTRGDNWYKKQNPFKRVKEFLHTHTHTSVSLKCYCPQLHPYHPNGKRKQCHASGRTPLLGCAYSRPVHCRVQRKWKLTLITPILRFTYFLTLKLLLPQHPSILASCHTRVPSHALPKTTGWIAIFSGDKCL